MKNLCLISSCKCWRTTEEEVDTAAASEVVGAGVCLPASNTDEKGRIAATAVGAGVSRPASTRERK